METTSMPRSGINRRDLLRMGLAGGALGVGGALVIDQQAVRAGDTEGASDRQCDQVEPTAGSWKTWVLTSGSEFRLPPPPGMAETRRELETVRSAVASLNATSLDRIRFWDAGTVYRWADLITARIGKGTPTSDSAGHPVTGL